MKKLIYIVLACASVLALVNVTRYISDDNSKAPGYYSEVMLMLFSMKTSSDFIINLPDSNTDSEVGVKLTSIISSGTQQGKARGNYQIDDERGEVLFNFMYISVLGPVVDNGVMYFAAPFSVSNQGSGVFTYIGLFEQDMDKQTIRHLDSYFIGDRIRINEMGMYDSNIALSFNQHSDQQAYVEAPTETVNLTLSVDDVMPTKLILLTKE